MKAHLENIAADQGWAFKYARPDYLAGDNGDDTPNNIEAGTIALFCDPIETRPDLNNEGTRQGFRYIGRFMLLEKSEIDETYADKYDNYIEQMIAYLEVLERELACQGIELIGWRWEEIINEHWSNMDGVLVNFEARVWDTTAPEIVTTLTLTNANQEITLTNPITAAVGTANKPSRFFLMSNTEGLTLTVNSETQATITGTPTVNTNAVLVARGKFGGFQVARLNITFTSAENEINITINGDAYDTVTENTDIPVVNSEDTQVGTVVGLDVVIADAPVSFTIDSVEVGTADIPAEKAVSVPIDAFIPEPEKITIQLTYATLSKTIWEATADAQGKGALGTIDAVPSVTSPSATINYSASTPVAGIAVNASTGQVSQSNYALIPTGANTLVIAWEVDASDPNYTGSGTVEITITKKVRWTFADLETATEMGEWCVPFYDSAKRTEAGGEVSAILAYNETTSWAQSIVSRRGFVTPDNQGVQFIPAIQYGFTTNITNIPLSSYIWISAKLGHNTLGHIVGANSENSRISLSGRTLSIIAGTSFATFSISATTWAKVQFLKALYEIYFENGTSVLNIYTDEGLIESINYVRVNSDPFSGNAPTFSGRGFNNTSIPAAMIMYEFAVTTGMHSIDDLSKLRTLFQYNLGLINEPPFV